MPRLGGKMDEDYISRLILGRILTKIIFLFSDDGPTREFFPIDRIVTDTGAKESCGFITAYAGNTQKLSLSMADDRLVEADVWGNGALKTLRRIKNEYLPAHYPKIKIVERTIVTKD